MSNANILLGAVATAWRRAIQELAQENEQLQIVGEIQNPVDILLQVKQTNANVVILSQTPNGTEPGICSHLLLEYPNVALVLVPNEAGPDVLCRMILIRKVREASKEGLRDMLSGKGPA
jgi:DNA-binding NarL/FixJ family response regulator